MSGTMRGLVLLFGFVSLSGCAIPQYETYWESYKKTDYSASVQSRICQSNASMATAEMRAKLAAHYNQELENCKNRAVASPAQTINVYPNGSASSGISQQISQMTANSARNSALQSCQMTRNLANINLGSMAKAHGQKAFEQCMVGAGFLSRSVCVANCK